MKFNYLNTKLDSNYLKMWKINMISTCLKSNLLLCGLPSKVGTGNVSAIIGARLDFLYL